MAKRPIIEAARSAAPSATAIPLAPRSRSATHPSAGSCTTSKSLSPNSTAPSVARLTP